MMKAAIPLASKASDRQLTAIAALNDDHRLKGSCSLTADYAAAEACGISRRTFFEWLERGERESRRGRSPVYVQFARAIRRAQSEARVSAEITVKKIDPKWWLSRMHRERPDAPGWNDTRSIEVTGKDGRALIPITLARQIIDLVESGDGE